MSYNALRNGAGRLEAFVDQGGAFSFSVFFFFFVFFFFIPSQLMFRQEEWVSLNFSNRNPETEATGLGQAPQHRRWATLWHRLKAQRQNSCKEGKKLVCFVNYN